MQLLIFSYANDSDNLSSCMETDSAPDSIVLTGQKRKQQRKIVKDLTSSSELSNDSFVFTGGKVHNRHTVSESQFSFDAHNDPPIASNVDGIGNLKEFSIPETQQNVEMCELSNDSFVFTGGKVHNRHTVSESQFSFDAHNDPPIAGVVIGKTPPSKKPSPLQEHKIFACRYLIRRGVHRKMVITTVYLTVRCMSLTWNPCVTLTLRLFYLTSKILTGAQKTLTGALCACKICAPVRIFARL